MAKQSKTLQLIASKLCVSDEEKVLSKAAEFERLLQMKSVINSITDTAKVVICLDLAAAIYRVEFDQKVAIKCSGLKGPSYMNSRKIIENVLELNTDILTVSALCLTLQCNVQDLAERILEEYKRSAKMELDMSLPQYVCMAVYQASRISKIKVSKSKLIAKSQLKPAQWAKLDTEWTKFADEKFASVAKKKRGRPAKTGVKDKEDKMEVDMEYMEKKEETEPQIEPYDDWKRRVLEKAYKELQHLKQNQNKLINTASNNMDSSNRQSTRTKQKETPVKQKDTLKIHKDMPIKYKNTLNKQKGTPNKQKDTLHLQNDTPDKHKDTQNKQKETLIKQKDTLIKYKDTPKIQKDTPNKQKDALVFELNDHKENPFSDFDVSLSPRRSPRTTPLKFEPYKSPAKNKGVRLLFPI